MTRTPTLRLFFLSFAVVLVLAPAASRAQDDDLQAALDALAQITAADVNAALVIALDTPDGTWTAAAGEAHPGVPLRHTDRFRIASMSKTFVGVVALMLADEGVIDLDAPVAPLLPPELAARVANADMVTLRLLLTMRSGIPDYLATDTFWDAVTADPYRAVWTPEQALAALDGVPANAAPDTVFEYSNSNYLLAQLALEAATGAPLAALVRARILNPLALDDTYTQGAETLPGAFVSAFYDWDDDGSRENVSPINDGWGLGDGALVSNSADLLTFYAALLRDETLLSADAYAELFDFQPTGAGDGYSFGLNAWETDEAETVLGHTGGVIGFLSLGAYLPDEDTTLIILAAGDEFDIETLAAEALALLWTS